MASSTDIARREAVALDRLTKTAARIAKRLPDVGAPEIPSRHRYPDMLALTQLTVLADFLDALDGAIKDEGYAATAKKDDGDTPSDAPETPETDEDADRAPDDAMAALDAQEGAEAIVGTEGEGVGGFAPLPDAVDGDATERVSEPARSAKKRR